MSKLLIEDSWGEREDITSKLTEFKVKQKCKKCGNEDLDLCFGRLLFDDLREVTVDLECPDCGEVELIYDST